MTDRARDEGGQILILVLGLTVVVFAVAGLAVDGTKAFLLQRSLQNVADSAAVSAATSIDRRAYYSSGGRTVRLNERLAQATARELLSERGLPLRAEFVTEDDVVEVVVTSAAQTTLLRLVGIDKIPVGASAVAEPFPQVAPNAP